jgi:DMSO/TMAO reductase YedYZ molybdopterin-dependent catalytic subunit
VPARGIRFPWANLTLLVLVALQLVTGIAGLLGSSDPYRVVFWLHAIGAYAIVVLLAAKATIVLEAIRRRPELTEARLLLLLAAALLVAVLASGLVWITAGSTVYLGGVSLINLHAYLALLLAGLLVWHALDRRWVARIPAARDRAAFLRAAGTVVAGAVLWQVERTLQAVLALPGSRRRFTGSYETGSFGGSFPSVSWLNDDPEPVEPASWRLVVDGAVRRPLALPYDDLLGRAGARVAAVLDCTGGWYTEQEWRGVPLSALLDEAGADAARSVSVESVTGYGRRFSIDASRRMLLATHVGSRPLEHGHGFPVRLVVPGERGFDWVKWVTRIHVHESSHLLQSPLPLA